MKLSQEDLNKFEKKTRAKPRIIRPKKTESNPAVKKLARASNYEILFNLNTSRTLPKDEQINIIKKLRQFKYELPEIMSSNIDLFFSPMKSDIEKKTYERPIGIEPYYQNELPSEGIEINQRGNIHLHFAMKLKENGRALINTGNLSNLTRYYFRDTPVKNVHIRIKWFQNLDKIRRLYHTKT